MISVLVPPAREPVTEEELRQRLNLDQFEDVSSYLWAARDHTERHTGRAFLTQTLRASWRVLDYGFEVRLPRAPVQAILSLTVDGEAWAEGDRFIFDGASGTLEAIAGPFLPGRRVDITFRAGYGDGPEALPPIVPEAILRYAATLYEYREDAVSGESIQAGPVDTLRLLDSLRRFWL